MTNPDEPIRFYFSVAPIQSAMRRSHDGGARLSIDVDQTGVAALNKLLDLTVNGYGVLFHATIVPIGDEVVDEPKDDGPRVVSWKERRK